MIFYNRLFVQNGKVIYRKEQVNIIPESELNFQILTSTIIEDINVPKKGRGI